MNSTSNVAAVIPPDVALWCANYAGFALTLAKAFLILALLVALIETALLLWAKIKALLAKPKASQPGAEESVALAAVDPVKLLEALKALLETLKGLPAWIAIFLAGLALLWIAGERPKACAPPEVPCSKTGAQNCPPARANSTAPNIASNTQGPTNTQ